MTTQRVESNDQELIKLIEHGRDREAADLASHVVTPALIDPVADPRCQLDEIVPLLTELIVPLSAAQLGAPTPCARSTVRDVIEHMTAGAALFSAKFRGRTPVCVPADTDLVASFAVAMANLRSAARSSGAMERTIETPQGTIPGDVFARFVAMDGLVHGWDIATATAQPYEPAPELVDAVDAFARQAITHDMRNGDMYAVATDPPHDASPLVRLVAFTGRIIGPSVCVPRPLG
ncbi:MAG TPA: TIGR03086 family metal-binding protein [Acidimicrobiales bacterium]|nr:TIGR03086 family metal-binding protein [Acidimicrobiales bacterium]